MKPTRNVPLVVLVVAGLSPISGDVNARENVFAGAIEPYVSQGGYLRQQIETLETAIDTQLSAASVENTVFRTTTITIDPLPLAVLAFEAMEGTTNHARYRISRGVLWVEEPPRDVRVPFSFIQVDRFDLSRPAFGDRPDELDSGGGAYLSWRLVTRPFMDNKAAIVAAGRSELSRSEAELASCLQSSCLSPDGIAPVDIAWGTVEKISDPNALVGIDYDMPTSLAAATAFLIANIGLEDDWLNFGIDVPAPDIEIIVDLDPARDLSLDAVMRRGNLMDDSVAAVWRHMRTGSGGNDVTSLAVTEAYECYRGPRFPSPGEYCP